MIGDAKRANIGGVTYQQETNEVNSVEPIIVDNLSVSLNCFTGV